MAGVEISDLDALADSLAAMRRRFPGLIPAAIHWGYIKHPLQPEQVQFVRSGLSADRPGGVPMPVWAGLALVRGLYLAALCVVVRWTSRRTLRALAGRRFSVIIKTWRFGVRSEAETDFYFGDLQHRLHSHGVDTLLLCGNARGSSWWAFSRAHATSSSPARLPELALVPWWAPLRIAWLQVSASRELRKAAREEQDTLRRAVLAAAERASLRGQTAVNALYDTLGVAVVRAWHPRAVLTLLEGHAWERCLWRGIKRTDPSCRTVGYQHTVIHPYNYAVLRPEPDPVAGPVPDIVLCLGERSRRLMSNREAQGATLIRFGSFRRLPEAASGPAARDRRAVLVTPEGRPEEVVTLFAFAAECARALPEYRFILRAHPDLPMAQALRLVGADVATIPNVVLSERSSINEDFRQAGWLLYRGSSTALYAILAGLRPVYADLSSPTIDPLADLDAWRRSCRTIADLTEILRTHETAPPDRAPAEWHEAVAYVDEYVAPVDDAAIDRLAHIVR